MAHINLLPWRSEERERKNRDFISWLALAFITAGAIAFFVWYLFNAVLEDQRQANQLIEAENEKLDVKLEQIADLEVRREAIISRMKVVQDLQGRRPVPVHVWHDVALAVPEAMYLNSFSRNGEQLTFQGRAANPNVVSNLVANLDASTWMEGAAVRNIQQQSVSAYGERTKPIGESPENSYVSFVVTTFIASELPDVSEDLQATEQEVAVDAIRDDQVNNPATDNLGTNTPVANNTANETTNTNSDLDTTFENMGDYEGGENVEGVAGSDTDTTNNNNELNTAGSDITNTDELQNNTNTNQAEMEGEMLEDNSIQADPNTDGQAQGGLT